MRDKKEFERKRDVDAKGNERLVVVLLCVDLCMY